ncbi:tapetum determinant 1 [Striga asiatica]|uniref:Tapetum determinant 1 n=1 Tax=Striga asiatica TaxID=4170 RepID=A0A5A7R507_STRAF|nr:tapetum determinant 1 [Striga asiatica]
MRWLASEGEERTWKDHIVKGLAFILIALFVCIYGALKPVKKAAASQKPVLSEGNYAAAAKEQLTSTTADDNNGGEGGSMNRIGVNVPDCSKDSILVFQGPTTRLPNGIPTYTVSIENVCLSGLCTFSDIHMSCGWFSSARLVDPKVFRRLAYDDCLVNDGGPFNPGDTLSFQYANTFAYPLSVTSLSC